MITFLKRIFFLKKETAKAIIFYPKYFSFNETLKYFNLWWKSLAPSSNSLTDASPWISYTAIRSLNQYLTKKMRVFEFGSGGSTLFFAKRVEKVVSVEHHRLWFEKVSSYLKEMNLTNIDYKLIEPEIDTEFHKKNIADPKHYISDDKDSFGKNYEKYVKSIDQFPDAYFDLVSVDGRARPSCCMHALPKIKIGGFLVYDNVETTYYEDSIALLKPNEWSIVMYYGLFPYITHFSMTLIAKKIS